MQPAASRIHSLLSHPRYRVAEFVFLTVGIPLLLYFLIPPRHMIGTLWLSALYCLWVHRTLHPRPEAGWWDWQAVRWPLFKPMLLRFAVCAALLTCFTLAIQPERFLGFVSEKPYIWAMVMLLYPVFSVLPQEFIFRTFFFERYAVLFPTQRAMIMASGLTFGFAHIAFHNWVAPLLCLVGGVIFSATYAKRKSLALVSVEHALYGCFLFTIGLGWYFYHGGTTAMAH